MKILIIENEFSSIKAPISVLVGQYKKEQIVMEYKVCVKSQDIDWRALELYEVIFVDLSLAAKSELDGYGILNKIKKEYPLMANRCAIITGNGKVEESLSSKGISMDEFKVFIKPLKYMNLKKFIDGVLQVKE